MSNIPDKKMLPKKLKWVIVIFTSSKDYSVVPINWLLETEVDNLYSSTIKNYYWPPFRVTSIHLKEAKDPEPSWQQYQIKVVGGNKTYDNFNKAWYKRVEVESTDTENILNDPLLLKKKKQNTLDSSDSDDEDPGYTIIPNIQGATVSGTLSEEPLQTFSTNNSASFSSAVDSTFHKENSYTDLQPLTLLNSNTIASLMQATDYMNLPTTSESSNTSMIICESSNPVSQNLESTGSQNQHFPNTIEKLSYPTIQSSSEAEKKMTNTTVATLRPRQSRPLVNVPVNLTEIVRQVANEIKAKPRIKEIGYKSQRPFKINKPNTNGNKTKGKPKKQNDGKFARQDAITRIAKQIHAIIIEPQLAIMLGIIFLALYVHHYHADESIIARAVKSLKANTASQHLGDWLENNVPKFFGMVIAAVVAAMMSKQYSVSIAVASIVLIIIMPTMSVSFYVITSLFSLLMTRLKTTVDRYIIAVVAVVAYLYFVSDVSDVKIAQTILNTTASSNTTVKPPIKK